MTCLVLGEVGCSLKMELAYLHPILFAKVVACTSVMTKQGAWMFAVEEINTYNKYSQMYIPVLLSH